MSELTKPLVLGVALEPPKQALPADKMLARTGQNTGNMLFAQAAKTLFPAGRYISFGQFEPSKVEGHDCIVLAAANWLSRGGDLGYLVERFEQTDVPIIALGLGAQAELGGKIPNLKPGMQRFVSILAERSPVIAARGQFSCEVLEHYGAKNARPTGCPSLLLSKGRQPAFLPATSEPLQAGDVVLHSTRHHFNQTDDFHAALYRQALAQGHDLLLQSELADFYPILDQLDETENPEKITRCLAEAYQAPVATVIDYLRKHGHVFFTVKEWLDYYRTKRFVLVTRIHGTIAAVLSGTPALLIAHDSRTLELAQTMNVPFISKQDLDTNAPLPIAKLYERALAHDFSTGFQHYWRGYAEAFRDSNLYSPLFDQASAT